jgi:hypothetical protein
MEFYLRNENIPEFKNLTKGQRTEVWAITAGRRFRDPVWLLALGAMLAILALCSALGSLMIPLSYGNIIGAGIGGGLGNFVAIGIMTPRARPHLAAEIKSRGW